MRMITNKEKLIVAGIASLCTLSILIFSTRAIYAQWTRIVRLYEETKGSHKQLFVEPNNLWVSKGTVIIWANQMENEEIKVSFEEGKKCADVTGAPTGFSLNAACFVTSWIPSGGTSSLRFNEEGAFSYVVELADGLKTEGKIVVRR